MRKVLILLGAILMPSALLAQSSPYGRLTGNFTITGRDFLDPPPGQKKDRLAMYLTGESAKRTYNAMPGKPQNYACEPGMRQKVAGGLECTEDSRKNYYCSVGIMLESGQTRIVSVC